MVPGLLNGSGHSNAMRLPGPAGSVAKDYCVQPMLTGRLATSSCELKPSDGTDFSGIALFPFIAGACRGFSITGGTARKRALCQWSRTGALTR
ncbi:hypothetical protein HMPREF1487_09084 [Pseudomonas sp. HPB0071]|nr:hypothetical protein HMPREF1487_09084 [Pseudomonas sp. HPB0071]